MEIISTPCTEEDKLDKLEQMGFNKQLKNRKLL